MRRAMVLSACALATLASANAVMGYALEQYDGRAWLVYVLATVAFEAWAVGRWAGFGWPKAVGISVLANFVTAGCCANLCGVGLHGAFVGSHLNPNPLANMALMFLAFGLLSGGTEAIVWWLCRARKPDHSTVLRSIGAHLFWVPIGMVIMLVPVRPYPMLEGYTLNARRLYLMSLPRSLERRILEKGSVPDYRDVRRFFREVVPLHSPALPDAWTAAYRPAFGRFATGISRDDLLWEWNPKASKLDLRRAPDNVWLIRTKWREDQSRGFRIKRNWDEGFGLVLRGGSEVRYTNDRITLGYAK